MSIRISARSRASPVDLSVTTVTRGTESRHMAKNTATPIPAHERHPSVTVDVLTPSLTVAERDTLADCEATIQRGMQTFIEVGNALMTIRNNRLYRAEFGTFEDYCNKRWRLSAAHSYRLIDAATVAGLISSPMGEEINISERATRELAPLLDNPEELKTVYEDARYHGDRSKKKGDFEPEANR